MKATDARILSRSGKLICVLVLTLAMMAASPIAHGQASSRANDQQSGNSQRKVSSAVGSVIRKAIKLVEKKKLTAARKLLATLNFGELNPYGLSRVMLILAHIDNLQKKYAAARHHLEKALASGGLTEAETSRSHRQIARLYFIQEKWAPAARTLEAWLAHAKHPPSQAYFMLSMAYYRQQKREKALPPARKAVKLMKEPKFARLQLLRALYSQLQKYDQAIEVAKRMVRTWPKKEATWKSLAFLYQNNKNQRMALATLQLAYNAGFFTDDSEYMILASMLRENEIPMRCARILKEALANGEIEPSVDVYRMLGSCYMAAREYEKSLAPLRNAARLSNNGKLYIRVANAQLRRKNWAGVAAAIRKALDKGGLDNPAHAQLLMGMALFKQNKSAKARPWLERAARDPDYRANATAFLNAINLCAKHPDASVCE